MPIEPPTEHAGEDDGCAFVLDDAAPNAAEPRFCAAPRHPGSAYCRQHHARCHLASGSAEERRQLRAIEALAKAASYDPRERLFR